MNDHGLVGQSNFAGSEPLIDRGFGESNEGTLPVVNIRQSYATSTSPAAGITRGG